MTNKKLALFALKVITVIAIAAIVSSFIFENNEEGFRIQIRWSAKIAALIFSVTFATSDLHYFLNNNTTKFLLKNRPYIGFTFGLVHLYHLLTLIYLQYTFHPVFTLAKKSSLLGGGLAYIFLVLMMITTFPSIRNKLDPKNWKALHTMGSFWIWIIFFRSYFNNVVEKERYYFVFGVVVLAFAVRVGKQIKDSKLKIQNSKFKIKD
ncbi:MAG: hypothetical protein HKN51_16990 [Saprospiraceae bacterium]|nr:hypothetical protein [Saprospiraceae bacterium]